MTVETAVSRPPSIGEVRRAIESGSKKAVEWTEAVFEQIRLRDPQIHAFLSLHPERALAQARRIDEMAAKGDPLPPLAGVPVGIKDVLTIEGLPATAGSKILEGYIAPYTATSVRRLEDAGAIILGKINCDERSEERRVGKECRSRWSP